MLTSIEGVTSALLGLALDAASLRQQAIAANIANANTEGYLPVQVNFESQLEDARRSLDNRGSVDAFSLAGIRLQLEAVPGSGGDQPRVQLDSEVGKLMENAVHFQALVKGLNRHLEILSTAVTEGKR